MSAAPHTDLVEAFESSRSDLVALAYRMLGDMARAEDMVQEAWLRWSRHGETVESPRAFLVTIVTRLCLTELDSARMRREQSRADRLPEPVAIDESSLHRLETIDQCRWRSSSAFSGSSRPSAPSSCCTTSSISTTRR